VSEQKGTYYRNLESLRKKLKSRAALLKGLAGSDWTAGATTLRTATLALFHSTAKKCAPVWYRSAHARLTDPAIKHVLRFVTGCLRPTPAEIFQSSQASNLMRFVAYEPHLARRDMAHGHLLHSGLTPSPGGYARRLKSGHPFVLAAQQLISSSGNNICAAHWADHQWNAEWLENIASLRTFIPDTGTHTPEMTLSRTTWVRLNCFRTGVERFHSCLH